MFKRIFTVFFLLIGTCSYLFGQSYQGPAQGSVPSGATISTDNFSKATSIGNPEKRIGNKESEFQITQNSDIIDFGFPTPGEGSNYIEDPAFNSRSMVESIILNNFQGIPDQGVYIPPDPYCAVGPNNFMGIVNSRFRIFDKEGNDLKTIEADEWFNNVFLNAGAFDPKVLYDYIGQRWIMVWLQENSTAHTANLLLSVSDDSDPIGTWYSWALPANFNGTTNSNSWTDYQGVGFDENAIYITCTQITWTGFLQGQKIRIIPKDQLYANTAGQVTWNDIWNIGPPPGSSNIPWHLRPSVMYSTSDKYFLLYPPDPFTMGSYNYFSVFWINDPLGTPSLGGVNVPVTLYNTAPGANQLGGGMTIETGGSSGQNEPKYRDGNLYFVHSVRNPSSATYSAVHYVKINTTTNTADEDIVMGDAEHWYFYPAVQVDQDGNVAMTYSRSGINEYIGAYFTTKLAADPAFSGSIPLRVGEANYVKDFGQGRNRWGDYNGIDLDPLDPNTFWIFTEYAADPANTWGTWTGVIRAVPYTGPHFYVRTSSVKFGSIEVDSVSLSRDLTLYNFGSEDINVTNIPSAFGPFIVLNNPVTATIAPYDSLVVTLQFVPTAPGYYDETFNVESNDPNFQGVQLTGTGYIINPVTANVMYASTGVNSGGRLLMVNILTGAADSIGSSPYDDVDHISKISANPLNNELYGLLIGDNDSKLLRVNATGGDAYILHTLNLDHMSDAVFDTAGTLYGVQSNGKIYTVDLTNGNTTYITDAGVNINSIAFDPTNNQIYGAALITFGSNKDRIYKLDLVNGGYTVVGNTGFGITTNDLEFDGDGNMYGVVGGPTQESKFIAINKTTGAGTEIGLMGYNEVLGLAFARKGITGVEEPRNTGLPVDYSLKQNYPNPFNPSTKIEYSLPVASNVTITVYNLLGEVVNTLVSKQMNAGYHAISWNSNDIHGTKVGSGVYFYELKANGTNGAQFTQIRKMVLLK